MINLTMKELGFAASESLKEVRTNLLYGNNKVIGFTSVSPSEGKTTMTVQLARQFAMLGKKTVVMECDLKRSSMHKALGIKKCHGVSEYLTGQSEEIINETNQDFDIIFAGKTPPNSSELLSSEKYANLIKMLRKEYDYVLIDTPPVSGTIDAQIIGGLVDGMVFVVRAKQTKTDDLKHAISTFEQSGIKTIGAILNRSKADRSSSHYYYYYDYKQEK